MASLAMIARNVLADQVGNQAGKENVPEGRDQPLRPTCFMCKHHSGTIRLLKEQLEATKGDSASRKGSSTFAQLQIAKTTKLESEVVEQQEQIVKLQKQIARMSRSGNDLQQMQETIVGLKAKLRECARGEGHGEGPHDETLQDQLSKADSTVTSYSYKLLQEKLAVESQKMEITELRSKLEVANQALNKQFEDLQGLKEKLFQEDGRLRIERERDEEHIEKLEVELDAANNEVERIKLNLDRSKSDWEVKEGELTTELERLRAVDVKSRGVAPEDESCSGLDEAAALALTGMGARTTQSQGHEARVRGPATPAMVEDSDSTKKNRKVGKLAIAVKENGGKAKGAAGTKRDWEAYWSKERALLKYTYEDRHVIIKHPGRPLQCKVAGCSKKTTSSCGGCQLALCTKGGNQCWAGHHERGYLDLVRGAEEEAKDAFERKKQTR